MIKPICQYHTQLDKSAIIKIGHHFKTFQWINLIFELDLYICSLIYSKLTFCECQFVSTNSSVVIIVLETKKSAKMQDYIKRHFIKIV